MKLLFKLYPKLKEVYDIVNKLRAIFRSKKLSREEAKTKLHNGITLLRSAPSGK